MNSLDIFIQTYFTHVRTESMTEVMFVISRIFDLSVYSLSIVFLVGLSIYFTRGKKLAILFAFVMTLGALASYVLKIFFNIPRPSQAVFEVFGQSFPSYHAVMVTIFFAMLIYIFDDGLEGFRRKFFNFLCICAIFIVSFSRIYLGVHWFSDVIFGIFLGIFLTCSSILIFKKIK